MDKLIAFFKDKRLKWGLSLLGVVYLVFLLWLVKLNTAYWLDFKTQSDAISLFVIFLFINTVALGVFIFTRRIPLTKIVSVLIPPVVFAVIILGFGNWYMILPPLVVAILTFFIVKNSENLKTVMGTIYLIIYVAGIVGYSIFTMFIDEGVSLGGVDLSTRDSSFAPIADKNGEFRVVKYVDGEGRNRRMMRFHIELNGEDMNLPFAVARKTITNHHLITRPVDSEVNIYWDNQNNLHIDDGSFDRIYEKIKIVDGDFAFTDNLDTAPQIAETDETNADDKEDTTSEAE